MLFRHALLQELISTVAAFLILVGIVIATTLGFNMIRFLPMLLSPSLPISRWYLLPTSLATTYPASFKPEFLREKLHDNS